MSDAYDKYDDELDFNWLRSKPSTTNDLQLEQQAKTGMLPLIISETGAPEEPVLEVVYCTSISGGADHVNNMPLQLTLVRKLADGTEYTATYIQTFQTFVQEVHQNDEMKTWLYGARGDK